MKKRDIWIDQLKCIACILVVLGHFFQSMASSGLMESSVIYQWFNRTIYYFHVPLFFICSGFLYQKYSRIDSFCTWKNHVLNKAIALGVPYFIFSLITWVLKTIFSDSVNIKPKGIVHSLFIEPISPYWYLYALFLIFVLIPTFRSQRQAVAGVILAAMLKVISIVAGDISVYGISVVMQSALWFVLGMMLDVSNVQQKFSARTSAMGSILLAVFLLLSLAFSPGTEWYSLAMGLLGCASIILIVWGLPERNKEKVWMTRIAGYFMPVFLMHTIFAAGFRAVLIKMGVESLLVHIPVGVVISFAGPIIAAEIMKRTVWLEFFLYPGKFIKIGAKQRKIDHV